MNFVRERVMRMYYGIKISDHFEEGVHPEERKFRGMDGEWRCSGVMGWYVRKVTLNWPEINVGRKVERWLCRSEILLAIPFRTPVSKRRSHRHD
jgi:hypothetical protein